MQKYLNLLKDEDVRRWYENLKAKSILTATVYLRTLGLYCELEKKTPKDIIEEAQRKELMANFSDFIRRMEREGKAGSYLVRFKKVIKSWLSYNNIDYKLKVNIKGEYDTPRIANERVPNKEELSKILRMASPRARVAIALMAYSGVRPESLGDYEGKDGIRISDFKEARIENKNLVFDKVPSLLRIRSNLSKARHQYFTFVGKEAVKYIQDYLKLREDLREDSPLLASRGKEDFLRTNLITRDIKEAIVKAGFKFRPYVLRAYFDTNLIIAESKGLISHPYLQFLAGHKGDIEARYSTNKGILPPDMVEDMRESYRKCLKYLEVEEEKEEEKDIKKEFRRQLLLIAGYKDEEIEKMDLNMKDEDFQRIIRERLLGYMVNNGKKQKVIRIDEIESYISNGWEFIALLPDNKAIVRLPTLKF